MLTLYDLPLSLNCYKVRLLLALLGVDYHRETIALDRPTVADVAPYPALAQCGDGDVSLSDYPAIRAWMTRMESLPGFVRILD